MKTSEEFLLKLLRELNENGDNEAPVDPRHRSSWNLEKLTRDFQRVPSPYTATVEQLGTSDAYFWGNIWIKNLSGFTLVSIVLSHFGNLAYLFPVETSEANKALITIAEHLLLANEATLVPEHIAMRRKNDRCEDTWFRRFFDYV